VLLVAVPTALTVTTVDFEPEAPAIVAVLIEPRTTTARPMAHRWAIHITRFGDKAV
jgi:hypothetical protein